LKGLGGCEQGLRVAVNSMEHGRRFAGKVIRKKQNALEKT
jgi:hypothetical protein